MGEFSEEALILLLRYGMGCIPEERREEAEIAIFNRKCEEDFVRELLPTAYQNLKDLVSGKIKEEDVRKYFLILHTEMAKKAGEMECVVFKAKVIKSYGKECVIAYNNKYQKVKCLEKVNAGDFVLVHLGYVVEKYDENLHTW